MQDYQLILIRSIVSFIILLVLTRIMGKKQLSQMTLFDYVIGITIGSIAASMSVDPNIQISNGIISLVIWGLFSTILGYVAMKSRKFLQLSDGRPTILIKNGKIIDHSLKKNQLTIDELMMLLREKGVFNLKEVETAIFETNGELSILKKTEYDPITPNVLKYKVKSEKAPYLLVVDRHVLQKNLKTAGYSMEWLTKELKKQKVDSVEDVFVAQVDADGNLYVDLVDS